MKYIINAVEQKFTKEQKPYYKVILTDSTGAEYDGVSIWSDFPGFNSVAIGGELEGTVTTNDRGYKNFKSVNPAFTSPPRSYPNRAGNMSAVMAQKAAGIKQSQDNKELGIKISSTIRMAVDIALAELSQPYTPADMQQAIERWRAWLWNAWEKNDSDYPPFNS